MRITLAVILINLVLNSYGNCPIEFYSCTSDWHIYNNKLPNWNRNMDTKSLPKMISISTSRHDVVYFICLDDILIIDTCGMKLNSMISDNLWYDILCWGCRPWNGTSSSHQWCRKIIITVHTITCFVILHASLIVWNLFVIVQQRFILSD